MPRLSWVFAGCSHFVGFVMRRFICEQLFWNLRLCKKQMCTKNTQAFYLSHEHGHQSLSFIEKIIIVLWRRGTSLLWRRGTLNLIAWSSSPFQWQIVGIGQWCLVIWSFTLCHPQSFCQEMQIHSEICVPFSSLLDAYLLQTDSNVKKKLQWVSHRIGLSEF